MTFFRVIFVSILCLVIQVSAFAITINTGDNTNGNDGIRFMSPEAQRIYDVMNTDNGPSAEDKAMMEAARKAPVTKLAGTSAGDVYNIVSNMNSSDLPTHVEVSSDMKKDQAKNAKDIKKDAKAAARTEQKIQQAELEEKCEKNGVGKWNKITKKCKCNGEMKNDECVKKINIEEEPELEDCNLAELEALHAVSGEKEVGKECVAMMCADGYDFGDDKKTCVKKSDKDDTGESGTEETDTETGESGNAENGQTEGTGTDEADADKLKEAEQAYADAKEKENSLANRMLSGATMAATGIGGMELAQGLAEKSADEAAELDMNAYTSTFQCRAGGTSYAGGTAGIELGGGNQLIDLYQEYVDLAADLKERKTALGMKAGIESEVVLDKASTGLYDDVGHGIENGTFASLYRASKGNENDANKLADAQNTSQKRIKGGAIAAGVGVVGGALGNSIINGKLGEMIKDVKNKNAVSKDNQATISELKSGLKSAGFANIDKLDFSNIDISALKGKLGDVDWSSLTGSFSGTDVTQVLNTTNAKSFTSSFGGLFGAQ